MAGEPDQLTVPVYPVPAVVVLTGVAPVTGAVTAAMAATEITVAGVICQKARTTRMKALRLFKEAVCAPHPGSCRV